MRRLAHVISVILLLSVAVFTQTSRGTVAGTVRDPSGAVIEDAAVELTHTATGVLRSTRTNGAGLYRFDAVDLGVHNLKITVPSFKTFLASGFDVEANRTITVDAALQVAVGETVIEVNGDTANLLVRDAPLRSGNFPSRDIANLPLTALNPLSLARTLPGVSDPAGSTIFGYAGRAAQFSVNGQRPRGNNYLLDGTDNNDIQVTGPAQAFDIADAVQEVAVQTSNFSVEFGRAGGGVFNVITRSGTNQLHGTAYWQFRSHVFNSVSNLDKVNNDVPPTFADNVFWVHRRGTNASGSYILLWRIPAVDLSWRDQLSVYLAHGRVSRAPALVVSQQSAAGHVSGADGRSSGNGQPVSARFGAGPGDRHRPRLCRLRRGGSRDRSHR